MHRTLFALLGLAVLGSLFAGVYYGNVELRHEPIPAFNPAPGEARSFGVRPGSIDGSPIHVEVEVHQGIVDVYIMDKEWARVLPEDGVLRLDRPFSYHAEHSATRVDHHFSTTLITDTVTWHTLVIDNSENYYDGDAAPPDAENGTASVDVRVRYMAEEGRSLIYAYLAAMPSLILVLVTLVRQARRIRQRRRRTR